MLIRFAAANHRSIKDPVELSLVAVDADRPGVRHHELISEGLLPLAALYGPNASGKSNVLDALSWVSLAARYSLRLWEDFIPRDPFRFGEYAGLPSRYELDFMVERVRHNYALHVADDEVLYEELLSYPERRPRQLFVREGRDIHFRRGLPGASTIKELLTPVTLAISVARRLEVPQLHAPARYIADGIIPFSRRRPSAASRWGRLPWGPSGINETRRLFLDAHRAAEESPPIRANPPQTDLDSARRLLKFADLGIEDVEFVEESAPPGERGRLDLRFVHRADDEKALFKTEEESDGTQMWFRLIGPALSSIRNGSLLLLDEIDASLHPLLSARLLDLFRDPRINTSGAQLVFTTHDTTLLSQLNRDEVWLTEKGDDGGTTLRALAEFGGDRVRKSLNLEKAYLKGRFGALPRLRDTVLLTLAPEPEPEPAEDSVPGVPDGSHGSEKEGHGH